MNGLGRVHISLVRVHGKSVENSALRGQADLERVHSSSLSCPFDVMQVECDSLLDSVLHGIAFRKTTAIPVPLPFFELFPTY